MKKCFSLIILSAIIMVNTVAFAKPLQAVEAEHSHLDISVNDEISEHDVLFYNDDLFVSLNALLKVLGKDAYLDEETQVMHILNSTNNQEQSEDWTEAIIFDDLEISLGSSVEFVTFSNQFSDKNGVTVVKVPIKIKNLNKDTHGLNMFYCNYYNSQGTKANDFNAYFDDSIDFAGKLRSGAELESFIYMEYDADGDYYVEFEDFFNIEEIKITVSK